MKYREFTRKMRDDGWLLQKQEGSHQKWVHPTKPGKVTVAGHPNDDIPNRHFEGNAQTGRTQMKKEFLVVFEKGKTSFGASAPDIPGCFAVGPTLEETRRRFLEAVEAHLEWLASDHDPIPEPTTTAYDFSREPGEETSGYFVEWLAISVPVEARHAISA